MRHLALFTTVSDREEARRMARTLVERRLAACAQVSEIESFYTWEGAVQNETEYRILFKTTDEACEALERAIRDMHSYDLPALHAVAFERIDLRYAEWIDASTSAHPG